LPVVPQLEDLRTLTQEQAKADVIEVSETRYNYKTPPGWISVGGYNAWERRIGRWRARVDFSYPRSVLSGRVRAADAYEDRWAKWGDVPPIVAHETLVDMQEMSTKA